MGILRIAGRIRQRQPRTRLKRTHRPTASRCEDCGAEMLPWSLTTMCCPNCDGFIAIGPRPEGRPCAG
jgi:uncharacterized OB-fold protein